jgi:hypothetical protein
VTISAGPSAAPAWRVEEAILQRVAERADEWFPGVGARPSVRLRRLGERPRAVLYGVQVGERSTQPRVVAKVRRGWPGAAQEVGSRPRLATHLLPASEQTALEFAGLTAIYTMFGTGDETFGAVRPLDHLAAEDTILMEYVDAPTLRDVLVRDSRFSRPLRRPLRNRSEESWRRAGAWLQAFQQQMPGKGLPARQATREEVMDRFEAFADFLTSRLGDRAVGEAAQSGAELAADILPERLTLAVGHGDFAPRNVFLLGDGRLAVFDPLPRWRVPRFDDLCRFLVAWRLQGAQLHTHGAAHGAKELDLRERAVIAGYGGGEASWLPELRCYQLLITLDKWSALVDDPSHNWFGRLRNASVELAAGYLRKETERLVELIQSGRS